MFWGSWGEGGGVSDRKNVLFPLSYFYKRLFVEIDVFSLHLNRDICLPAINFSSWPLLAFSGIQICGM